MKNFPVMSICGSEKNVVVWAYNKKNVNDPPPPPPLQGLPVLNRVLVDIFANFATTSKKYVFQIILQGFLLQCNVQYCRVVDYAPVALAIRGVGEHVDVGVVVPHPLQHNTGRSCNDSYFVFLHCPYARTFGTLKLSDEQTHVN